MLKKGITICDEELDFIIKTVLILTASNYAKIKTSNVDAKLVTQIRNYFKKNFISTIITSHSAMENFVIHGAKIIGIFIIGYSIFCINLIVKRLGVLINRSYLKYLDVPLNRNELNVIGSGIRCIKDVTDKNYKSVMNCARKFAGSRTLYEWELEEYNK